ncbi:uncharacterized protein UV8b_01451 [Ustilaginoidea virens]|uniref:Uncharacterized protein n=1 Tax=Ustilaginoidea virens TaxID=1159556 RepID=A0A8E5HKN4_USTVR|nr:uncharacterized protein UV8b_01451 [Ustilaginoidea virens]QUC17210.1 hypothetical protein UV8b_01451 [Ustilaginoidea virens]
MAQAASAASTLPTNGLSLNRLAEKEAYELQQYNKIIRLRDAIIAGKHPTITVPRSLAASPKPVPLHNEGPRAAAEPALHGAGGPVATAPLTRPDASARHEPNRDSDSLEKSDQLVIAELQLQRQRLERALKDEFEQRRSSFKVGQAEPSSDLDLSHVLAKALDLVQADAVAPSASASASASAAAAAASSADGENLNVVADTTSDSLDESTFYSSRHDTPDSHLTSRVRTLSESQDGANRRSQHEQPSRQANTHVERPSDPVAGTIASAHPPHPGPRSSHAAADDARLTSQISVVPGLNNYIHGATTGPSVLRHSKNAVGKPDDLFHERAQMATMLASSKSQAQAPPHTTRPADGERLDSHPPSPLIRNHSLQVVAPQPTHPSSLSALAKASPIVPEATSRRSTVGTTAQVVALRTENNNVTSPDSSSQGGKKRSKKKKRKADKQETDPETVPRIKPEPRSPSPLNAPSFTRPTKRQRQVQGPPAELGHAPRYNHGNAVGNAGIGYVAPSGRASAVPVGHVGGSGYPQQQQVYSNSAATGESSYSGYYGEQWVLAEEAVDRQAHPADLAPQYSTRPVHPPRAVSQVIVADPYSVGSRPYREYHDGSRSTHAEGEAFIPPPRPAPSRILVDAYGREYIEPPQHTASRPYAVPPPPPQNGEQEIVYERLPSASLSRHAAPRQFEDGGSIVYRAPAPPPSQVYPVGRRLISQPEYAAHDYRDERQREYSARPPLAAQGEFVQVLAPPERRYNGDEGYGLRPASVRPVEAVRYQMAPDFGRVHAARPELHGPPEYRASVHPDGRREVLQPYLREYHPSQEPVMRRSYSVRPVDGAQSGQLGGGVEVAYLERPSGGAQEMVYTDDARREGYR